MPTPTTLRSGFADDVLPVSLTGDFEIDLEDLEVAFASSGFFYGAADFAGAGLVCAAWVVLVGALATGAEILATEADFATFASALDWTCGADLVSEGFSGTTVGLMAVYLVAFSGFSSLTGALGFAATGFTLDGAAFWGEVDLRALVDRLG